MATSPKPHPLRPTSALPAPAAVTVALLALEASGGEALLVVDRSVVHVTPALRRRLSRRRLAELAVQAERCLHAAGYELSLATALMDMDGETLHVIPAGGEPGTGALLVVIAPPTRRHRSRADMRRLTPRQLTVGRLMAGGATTREVAEELGVTVATVRRHLEAVHARLGIRRRAELVQRFAREGQNDEGAA